jgi:hypothetical protein
MSWRETARPIISKILNEHTDEAAIKKALFDAYPFGERRYHPYKIWLDEIRRQRGLKGKADMETLERLGQERLL